MHTGFAVRNRCRIKTMSTLISAVELTNHSLTITARVWNSSLTSDIYIICENIYFCCSFRKAKCTASIKSATSNTNWLHPSDLSFYLRKAVISNPKVRVTCATLASPDVITRRLRVPSVWVFSEMCHICGHIKPGLLVLMLLVRTIFQPEPVVCM